MSAAETSTAGGAGRSGRRLALIGVFFALGFCGITAQLARIQIAGHERFVGRAMGHQFRRVVLDPERGRIRDREGRILAFTADNASLCAMREEVGNPAAIAAALDSLGIDGRTIREKLRGERGFVWLARRLLPEGRARAVADRYEGVHLRREPKRVRPGGTLAASLIGRWSEEPELVSGIERTWDEALTGEPGWETLIVDAFGGRYATERGRMPRAGSDLELTIDARMQVAAETALSRTIRTHDAEGGAVIVVDVETGEILAMASHGSAREGPGPRNRAVLDAFEMGSCAKTFTVAAALEEGVADTSTRFFCGAMPGEERPPTVRDDHGKPGWLSLTRVVAESRNTGTARIARRVGEATLHRYLERFGFGQPTGIDLDGEASGRLRAVGAWSGRSLESVAIGYEFSATPLQIAMAYAAVANGGYLFRPRLVRAEIEADGKRRATRPEVVRRVISEKSAEALRAVLRAVALPGGTGENANVTGLDVAGKTGTARKYDAALATYSSKRHVSSFVGFAPWHAPRIVCAVMIDEPRDGYYGSTVAAPCFAEVVARVAAIVPEELRLDLRTLPLVFRDVAPAPVPGEAWAAPPGGMTAHLPVLSGYSTLSARRLAVRLGYDVEVLGRGDRVRAERRGPGGGRTLVLDTGEEAGDEVIVPDLSGLGHRRARAVLARVGLALERRGRGSVSEQRPPAGARAPRGSAVRVALEEPERSWGFGGASS